MRLKSPKKEADQNPKPNPSPYSIDGGMGQPMEMDDLAEVATTREAEGMTREEVLRRRSLLLRKLLVIYKREYWALAEKVQSKHLDYYWDYGKSPLADDLPAEGRAEEKGEVKGGDERKRCGAAGCKIRAMPLARWCHGHILFDAKQTLYKPCTFVIKSTKQTGQITCGRPVTKAAPHSLCHAHLQRAQKNILHALKKAGVNMPSSSKTIPSLGLLISECVRNIQAKRKDALNASKGKAAVEVEDMNGTC